MPTLNTNRAKSGPKTQSLRVNDPNVSYVLKEEVLEKYGEAFLKNVQKIQGVISQYVSKHSSLYGARAPSTKIPFTDYDKANLFKAAGITSAEITKALQEIRSNDIDLRNRIINDPFNELCALLTGWFLQKKDRFKKPDNEFNYPYYHTALYLSMRFYCSIFYRTFQKFDPDPDVLDYTIEHISGKFLLKKANNIFDIVRHYAETSVEYKEERLMRGADIDYVYYCTDLNSRISEFMKSFAAQYYKNYEEKKKTETQSASKTDDEGDFYVGQTSDISAAVDSTVRMILTKFVSDNSTDELLVNAACDRTKFSRSKFVVILNRIRENSSGKLRDVLSLIIMYYLVTTRKDVKSIRSSEFVNTMLNVYSVSNTKNETIIKLKALLEEIINENAENIVKEGNKNMVDRVKNCLYAYLVLFIAKNIEQ